MLAFVDDYGCDKKGKLYRIGKSRGNNKTMNEEMFNSWKVRKG